MSEVFFSLRGVCVEPPPVGTGVKYKLVNGVKLLDVSTGLQQMKVVHGTDIPFFGTFITLQPGEFVVVNTQAIVNQKWSSEVYTHGGKTFVCVPYESVFSVVSVEPDAG